MRLICPHCMSGVTVPDDAAGKDATCPNCGKAFPTPARYSAEVMSPPVPPPPVSPPAPVVTEVTPPAVNAPPAPPGYVPPIPPPVTTGFLPPAPATAAQATVEGAVATGYAKSIGITISPKVVAWLPAILLTCVFVFTFFPWVGCYAGSAAVYSQRPWGAMFNSTPNPDYKLEAAGTIPGGWLDKKHGDWQLMLPFFLALILAIVFAWAERGFGVLDPRQIPPLAKLWPWRHSVIAGCAALALLLLLLQWANGFGLERAIKQHISERFADAREKAKGKPSEENKLEYEEQQEFNKYNLEHTTWFYLAIVCMLLSVLAVMTRAALDNRGNKPPPKLLLHY